MAHYAKVQKGIVTRVIVAEPEFFDKFVDDSPGKWVKTSYNMKGGVYFDPETRQPAEDQSVIQEDEGRMRKNFAGVGFIYDKELDAFYPKKPYDSWTLNETRAQWEPPVAMPDDFPETLYEWDEENLQWVEI
jgi:hypothetical protein